MKIIQCMVPEICSVTDEFFLTLDHFLLFYFPNNPKNHSFHKMKKNPTRDVIILYMCTINENHMMYVF